MVEPWQELSNYCKKHDLRYMRFLPVCPICRGEALADMPSCAGWKPHIPVEMIPNKGGDWWKKDRDEVAPEKKPVRAPVYVQMDMFDF